MIDRGNAYTIRLPNRKNHESLAKSGPLALREHFIPIRKSNVVRRLLADPRLPDDQRERFEQMCFILAATLHYQYHARLEELKDLYAPFDPDRDTSGVEDEADSALPQQVTQLFDRFVSLLERANYRKLSQADIEMALHAASHEGVNLDVDFEVFDRLEIYSRGTGVTRKTRRRLRRFYRAERVELPVYRRLIMMFRLREHRRLGRHADSHAVYMKLFKDIPQVDLEMLLPGSRIRMTLLDRSRILLPTLSGLALTLFKIIKGAIVLTLAGAYGLLGLLGLVGGTIGYGVKSFFGYLRTKDKYQLNLTRNLYFQNLDNNAGVLFRLLDDAEEQEFREAILAYFLLWRDAPAEGWTQDELDASAESLLRQWLDQEVDFEVDDAVDKLVRMNLVELSPDGRLRAVPIDEALRKLDHTWDNLFTYNTPDNVVPDRHGKSPDSAKLRRA